MSAAAKAGKGAIRIANEIVNLFVLIVILLLLVFGSYAIWDSGQVYAAADAARYAVYKPTAAGSSLSFQDLKTINPEVFSWLTVYGTHIDYPVTQASDDMKYINTDAEGHYSLSGSIFLDAGCSKDFSDFSSIIYGHHMDKDTMFGEIGLFTDKTYFDAHPYGELYYGGQRHGIEFFAFVHDDAYDTALYRTKITGADARQSYLDLLYRMSINTRSSVPVTTDDRIVLLSTCSASTTNGRDLLIGKITDQTYPDTFKTITTEKANTIPVIGALPGLWAGAPLPVRIVTAALPFLLILLAIIRIIKKKRRKRKNMDPAKEMNKNE